MKKKIILLGLCFLLLLIFTSSSYGGLGVNATPIKAVPDQELAGKVTLLDLNCISLLIVPDCFHTSFIIPIRISVRGEYPDSKAAISQEIRYKAKVIERAR